MEGAVAGVAVIVVALVVAVEAQLVEALLVAIVTMVAHQARLLCSVLPFCRAQVSHR